MAASTQVTANQTATEQTRPDLVTTVIDDVEVSVPKGTLVIRAAEQVGIAIPRFCDHPLLAPVGACRQCLVEVATPGPDGSMRAMPKPQASCTLEVTEGRDSTSVGLAWGHGQASVGWDPASGPGDLLVSGSQSAGWPGPALFGVVSERVASVTVEGPGLPPTEVELHPAVVGETELKVFAVFPPASGPVTVVALDAAGAEVVRKGVSPAT